MGGTSVSYLLGRLEKAGRTDLLDGIARGRISVYAAGIEAGFLRRKPTLGTGSPNAAKRRRVELQRIAREAQAYAARR